MVWSSPVLFLRVLALGLSVFGPFAATTDSQAAKLDDKDPANKMIDVQLKTILKGIKDSINVPLSDGSVITDARLVGRVFEIKVRLPILDNQWPDPSFEERRVILKRSFCQGETAKLIENDTVWSYSYYDRRGRQMAKIRIDHCR
jgi:hypothetical protein